MRYVIRGGSIVAPLWRSRRSRLLGEWIPRSEGVGQWWEELKSGVPLSTAWEGGSWGAVIKLLLRRCNACKCNACNAWRRR